MARANGRNLWIAWPIGVICAAVVAALLYVAQPMIPVVAGWTGSMFYAATHLPGATAADETVAAGIAQGAEPGSLDCRALYPDDLWAELIWTPDVLLSQNLAPPSASVTVLADALAPTVLVTCSWRAAGGISIASTLARVPAEFAEIAGTALREQGFSCTVDTGGGGGVACSRARAGVIEEYVVRDGLWLSSVQSSWHPSRYGARLAANVWG